MTHGAPFISIALASLVACSSPSPVLFDAAADASAPATGISVTPSAAAMLAWPATEQLTAIATYSDGSTRDVTATATWTSSDDTIATVAAGLVSTEAAGSSTITAEVCASSTCSITVHDSAALAVTVPTLAIVDARSLSIDFFPANASGGGSASRSISGALTTLVDPDQIAVIGDELFVTDLGAHVIDVFPTSGSGDLAPSRQLTPPDGSTGAFTDIVAVGGQLYVSDGTQVLAFPSTGTGNIADLDVTLEASASGSALQPIGGMAIANGVLYVAYDGAPASAIDSVALPTSSGSATVTSQLAGASTGLDSPDSLLVVGDALFVSNTIGDTVTSYAVTATGDIAPTTMLTTTIGHPGEMLVLGAYLYVADFANDAIDVFAVTATGGTHPLWQITSADGPTGIASF